MTEEIFRHDSYCRECEATVVSSGPDGIVLDRTVFYPNGGGQPGDQGVLRTAAGDVTIVDTLKGANGIRHVPVEGADLPAIGSQVTCAIDWARRYRHMRMHSCMQHARGRPLGHAASSAGCTSIIPEYSIRNASPRYMLKCQSQPFRLHDIVAGP